jgi:hypothetical protein
VIDMTVYTNQDIGLKFALLSGCRLHRSCSSTAISCDLGVCD